jgi:hypothetical protein
MDTLKAIAEYCLVFFSFPLWLKFYWAIWILLGVFGMGLSLKYFPGGSGKSMKQENNPAIISNTQGSQSPAISIGKNNGTVNIYPNPQEDKKKLQEEINRENIFRSKDFFKKYPNGFIIFGIFKREIILPNKSFLPEQIKIDWGNAKLIKLNDKEVTIRIPNIHGENVPTKSGGIIKELNFSQNNLTIPLIVGFKATPFAIGPLTQSIEIIKSDEENIICLFGLE